MRRRLLVGRMLQTYINEHGPRYVTSKICLWRRNMHGDAGGMMATEPRKKVVLGVKCPTPTPRLPDGFIYYHSRKGNLVVT